jgi:alpha,alpha-trehalase
MEATTYLTVQELSPLYEEVQMSGLFADSKYFVDAIPLQPVGDIMAAYTAARSTPDFNLRRFVETHFQLPAEADNSYRSANKPIHLHLSELWNILTRTPDQQAGTLIPLPHPYIVPGGRFREVYYWDSYFTMLGLQVSKRVDLIENMVSNFAHLINTLGFIPNGNRSYYLGRSQPPFFASMVLLLMEEKGEEILSKYLSPLEKEYAFWMDGVSQLSDTQTTYRRVVRMPDGAVLNRYWDDMDTPRPEAFTEDKHLAESSGRDPKEVYRHIRAAAESGWDFSSRWFSDGENMQTIQTTDLIPVDLNCLLCSMEMLLSIMYGKLGQADKDQQMLDNFVKRKKAIQTYCWSEEKGFYFDHQFRTQQLSEQYTLASVFPLYFPIADIKQSASVAKVVEAHFLQPGGLRTTLRNTGQQWDAPNGWAPLQWIAYQAFNRVPYEHKALARQIKDNWMRNNEKVYAATGKMMEKYNVSDTDSKAGGGEYPNQDGFGWTNGVYLAFSTHS